MHSEIKDAFERGEIADVIRLMDKHFGKDIYSLWHLFKDEQRKIFYQLNRETHELIEASYREIYKNNAALMNFSHRLSIPIARPLLVSTEYILNIDIKRLFETEEIDLERLSMLIEEAKRWPISLETTTLNFVAGKWIDSAMKRLKINPDNVMLLENIVNVIRLSQTIPLQPDTWKAQNIYFWIGKNLYNEKKKISEQGNGRIRQWVELFTELGELIHARVTDT